MNYQQPSSDLNQRYYKALNRALKPDFPYHLRLWLLSDAEKAVQRQSQRSLLTQAETTECLKKLYSSHLAELRTECLGYRRVSIMDAQTVFNQYQAMAEYKDEDLDVIFDEGFEALLSTHFGLPPTPLNTLLVAYVFQSRTLGEVRRAEFIKAVQQYGFITEADSKYFFAEAVTRLTSTERWLKDVYLFSYQIANGHTPMSTISLPKAISIWNQVFPLFPTFQTYKDIIYWLQNKLKVDHVTRDFFNNLYDFGLVMKDKYHINYNFNKDDGWNSLLDQFVLDFLDLEVIPVDFATKQRARPLLVQGTGGDDGDEVLGSTYEVYFENDLMHPDWQE